MTHSEYNGSSSEIVHLLQIWILPEREGLPPSYEQKHFPRETRDGVLRLVASREGKEESVRVHQDASIYASLLGAGTSVAHELSPGRHAWLQIVRGSVAVGGSQRAHLEAGDGAAIGDEPRVAIEARTAAELLLFDLA